MNPIKKLILYRHFEEQKILEIMSMAFEQVNAKKTLSEERVEQLYVCAHELSEMAGRFGYEGNIWHCYLTHLLANNENSYSTACEIVGEVEGSVNEIALHDFEIFKALFDMKLEDLCEAMDSDNFKYLIDYKNINENSKIFNKRIRDRICELSVSLASTDTVDEFKKVLTQFYKEFGVGKLGLHKAFRIDHVDGETQIIPITNIAHVRLDDLVGYEIPKQKLIENTEAFVEGRKANNCLLFGDAGTGKSSSIKGILN